VLVAARGLFAEHGFAATRIDDIATQAGVAKGAVFHHYDDKRAVLDAVAVQVADEVMAQVGAAADAATDPVAAIEAGSIAFIDACLDPGVRRIYLTDAPGTLGWARWREIDAARSMRSLEQGIAAVVTERRLALDVAATTHLLSGAINELVFWLAAQDDRVHARLAVVALVRHVVQRTLT
jgi:AcrR family transcriptional regulator